MRTAFRLLVIIAAAAWLPSAPCRAQGIGVGLRYSVMKADVEAGTEGESFKGGQIRASLSTRTGLEVSLDRRSAANDPLTQRVRDYPLQASLLLFPVRSTFSPYVLGGIGWYTHRVEQIAADTVVDSTTTRRFGSHAGFGAELRLGRHAGLHADYRYTFLRFGDDDSTESQNIRDSSNLFGLSASRFLPSYEGSMWTAGLTVYF